MSDTGCGIAPDKLESIFREFEQVEVPPPPPSPPVQTKGLGVYHLLSLAVVTLTVLLAGLGLAVVARIVEQLGGQLRVDSKVDEGSRFSFLIPFAVQPHGSSASGSRGSISSQETRDREIESLVNALTNHPHPMTGLPVTRSNGSPRSAGTGGSRSLGVATPELRKKTSRARMKTPSTPDPGQQTQLRVLIVEVRFFITRLGDILTARQDNDINRTILAKRLTLEGHIVVNTTNGQEGVDMIQSDQDFDCVLMDIQ